MDLKDDRKKPKNQKEELRELLKDQLGEIAVSVRNELKRRVKTDEKIHIYPLISDVGDNGEFKLEVDAFVENKEKITQQLREHVVAVFEAVLAEKGLVDIPVVLYSERT